MIDLPNKPLIEALLELKWVISPHEKGVEVDPYYKLLVGSLYSRVKKEYPHHQPLPAAEVPDELTPHVVKHQFRVGPGRWPLVQVGPGVASVNCTDTYTWNAFSNACTSFYDHLVQSYQESGSPTAPQFSSVMLRYINTLEKPESLLDFVREKLHTTIDLPDPVETSPHVAGQANEFRLAVDIPLHQPEGVGSVRMGTGLRNDAPALFWELVVVSKGRSVPQTLADFGPWLGNAHQVAESWFFAIIDGELLDRFGGGRA